MPLLYCLWPCAQRPLQVEPGTGRVSVCVCARAHVQARGRGARACGSEKKAAGAQTLPSGSSRSEGDGTAPP